MGVLKAAQKYEGKPGKNTSLHIKKKYTGGGGKKQEGKRAI